MRIFRITALFVITAISRICLLQRALLRGPILGRYGRARRCLGEGGDI